MVSEAVRDYLGEQAHWLMTPVRAIIRGIMVLVNLSPLQMAALCTLAMLGGIISNSFQMYLYFQKVEQAALMGLDNTSPLYSTADKIILYLSIMSAVFALTTCLIAFNAEWFRVKGKDWEAMAGKKNTQMPEPTAEKTDDVPPWIQYRQEPYGSNWNHHSMHQGPLNPHI